MNERTNSHKFSIQCQEITGPTPKPLVIGSLDVSLVHPVPLILLKVLAFNMRPAFSFRKEDHTHKTLQSLNVLRVYRRFFLLICGTRLCMPCKHLATELQLQARTHKYKCYTI